MILFRACSSVLDFFVYLCIAKIVKVTIMVVINDVIIYSGKSVLTPISI